MSSAEDLRRGTVAAHAARLLSKLGRERCRSGLRTKLEHYQCRVHVIVGAEDPLTNEGRAVLNRLGARARVTMISGAGHHPQLTHDRELAQAIRDHTLSLV